MSKAATTRTERDTMGEVAIPADRLWGANTERARRNLPLAPDAPFPRAMLRALARIKAAVAKAAATQGYLPTELAGLIEKYAMEIVQGRHWEHFPLDAFQTGSGTSSNMNVNEVIANLASLASGQPLGSYQPLNPNDHVNFGQSSNDTVPSALHLGALETLENQLLPELGGLIAAWRSKAENYADVIKTGRTHLQDALPVTFGHVFGAYVGCLSRCQQSLKDALPLLAEIPLGGTAVGTGFQAPVGLAAQAAQELSLSYGREIRATPTPLVFMAGRPVAGDVMGRVAGLAMELVRIANDVRMMASGPRLGLGELEIPSLQPGSSIMPGKVNPVVCESVVQAGLAVMGHQTTVTAAASFGQFELNVTLPVTGWALIGSIELLANTCSVFRSRLVEDLKVNTEAVGAGVGRSLALVTALISRIGYAEAAKIAYHAHRENLSPAQAAVNTGVLTPEEAQSWLDPARLVKPGRME